MPLRLTIHNSLLLAFLLMSLLLLVSITLTWRAFDEVEREQQYLIGSQIPKIARLGHVIDDGLVLLGLVSLLSRDMGLDEYNAISSQALDLVAHMNKDLVFLQEDSQGFTDIVQLLTDIQALEQQIDSLLMLRKDIIDNQAFFVTRQATLQQQIESAFVQIKLIVSSTPVNSDAASIGEDLLFSVKRMEDIIRFLVLIDSPAFLQQEKNQYRLLVNRLSFQMLAFSIEQRREISSALSPLLASLVEENSLFDVVSDKLSFEILLLAHQEAIAQLSVRLNEEYRSISLAANTGVENNAAGLLKTISFSKNSLLIFFALFLLLIIVIFYYFVRPRIVERLQALNQSTHAIAYGNFDVVIDVGGNDEVADMAQSLAYFRDELVQKEKDQQALAANEKTLSTIIKNASEGLFTVDVYGNIQSFNPACELIFDADAKDVVGNGIEQLLPEQRAVFSHHQQEWVEEDGLGYVLCERQKVIANTYLGVSFTGSLSVTLVRLRNQLIYSCFIRDITAEELSKKQLDDLVQELSSSNADLERFAYSCSHDLQEPIRMVASFSGLLQDYLVEKGDLDETSERYLGFINQGAVNAKQLVIDILEYSRLDQGSSNKSWITVKDVFEQIESMLQNLLEEKNGQLRIENGDVQILMVPAQFRQLLMNLMINGLKYNEGERPIVTVSVLAEPDYWLISVTDNGIGIDPAYQSKIFDLFARLVSRRDYSGSGIGLSLCKKIVDKHNGTISVTSKVGEGARFDVTLPRLD